MFRCLEHETRPIEQTYTFEITLERSDSLRRGLFLYL
jgi:hypothetical protein